MGPAAVLGHEAGQRLVVCRPRRVETGGGLAVAGARGEGRDGRELLLRHGHEREVGMTSPRPTETSSMLRWMDGWMDVSPPAGSTRQTA